MIPAPPSTLRDKGFWLTLMVAAALLLVFFGNVLRQPNRIFFSKEGDGFQTYYTALYHIEHDSAYGMQSCMNYPFHESVFFTGCEPVISNPLKWLNRFVPVGYLLPGITNLVVLLSLVVCAAYLYLLLRRLQVPWLWAMLFAVGITYVSPQLWRLPGHHNLTYQFAIPFFLYQLLRFSEQPTLRRSLGIGVVVFLLAATHLYFYGFFAMLSGVYWLVLLAARREPFTRMKFALKHIAIQLILPLLLLQVSIYVLNDVQDRTSSPWGILVYKSSPDGILFPFGKFYESEARLLYTPPATEWEGWSYIGLFGWISMIGLLLFRFRKGLRPGDRLNLFDATGNRMLNIFFWASVVSALYACGYLLFIHLRHLLPHMGILRQMRGIGRFAWLFYYMLNIAGAVVWYRMLEHKSSQLRSGMLILFATLLGVDTWANCHELEGRIANRIPEWEDKTNSLPENAWLQQLSAQRYQAILPLPFFHIGSENWTFPAATGDVSLITQLVSLKTGLPMVSMTSSRSSLSQTWLNLHFGLEECHPLDVLRYYPNKKPLLVLAWPELVRTNEQALFQRCKLLHQRAGGYSVYELPFDSLLAFGRNLYEKQAAMLDTVHTWPCGPFSCSDSLATRQVVYEGFEKPQRGAFHSKGMFCSTMPGRVLLLDTTVCTAPDSVMKLSLWLREMNQDLRSRTYLEFYFIDSTGQTFNTAIVVPAKELRATEGGWALAEADVVFPSPTKRIRLWMFNDDIPAGGPMVCVDELLIRPARCTVFKLNGNLLVKNNRYYFSNPF